MSGDFCTNDGARKLKDKIEAYWRDRGYDVDIDLVEAGFVAAMRSGRTDVRSDMINGMPTKREHHPDVVSKMGAALSTGHAHPQWLS